MKYAFVTLSIIVIWMAIVGIILILDYQSFWLPLVGFVLTIILFEIGFGSKK